MYISLGNDSFGIPRNEEIVTEPFVTLGKYTSSTTHAAYDDWKRSQGIALAGHNGLGWSMPSMPAAITSGQIIVALVGAAAGYYFMRNKGTTTAVISAIVAGGIAAWIGKVSGITSKI